MITNQATVKANYIKYIETKEEAKEQFEETITMVRIVGELITENKDEFFEAAKPVLNLYKEMLQVTVKEVANINVQTIIKAVEDLEAAGFTREQAITLLKR